jgi:RHS repeat-associated protein
VEAGSYWSVEEQDASGNVLRERFGNGLVQKYERDVLGLSTVMTVERPDGTLVYDVGVTRNEWLAIETVTDRDGHGLDHTASFGYDPQGRLTSATLGAGGAARTFGYTYDGLQNMTARQAAGPTVLPVLAGIYRYGERGHGPRQLTSVQPATGAAHTFDYDPAGRLRAYDGLSLTYDGLDQLVRVDGLGAGHGNVQYAYGYDGQRIKTVAPDGAVTYWFSDGASERDGTREHLVTAGDQLIARVTGAGTAAVRPAGPAGLAGGPALGGLVLLGSLVALVCAFLSSGRPRRLAAGAGAVLLAAGQLSCGAAATGRESAYVWQTNEALYFHTGISPGPTLFTREDGSIAEERRFEPFGAPIESYRELDSGPVVGPVDFAANDHNSLAKRTDPATGWSYHGARWMDPATARWLTPDPPVKAPDPAFLDRPWALHPYQYVEQSPIEFWDPDGENRRPRGHARRGRLSRFSEENYETWTARSHARARAWEARQRERARRVEQMWRDMLSQPHDSFTLRPGRGVTQLPIWTRDAATVKYIGHVTMRLQRMATRAADRVDSLGLQALQAGEAQAIREALRRGEHGKAQRLWAMNRGSAIDRLVRGQARKDPLTAGLRGASNNGADFWHPRLPRLWWDVTTQGGWKGHSIKYGEWGIHISTGVTSPVPGGTRVPRTGPD